MDSYFSTAGPDLTVTNCQFGDRIVFSPAKSEPSRVVTFDGCQFSRSLRFYFPDDTPEDFRVVVRLQGQERVYAPAGVLDHEIRLWNASTLDDAPAPTKRGRNASTEQGP